MSKIIINAVTAIVAMGISNSYAATTDTKNTLAAPSTEKCYGIAKSGQNDCATAAHGCSGEAKNPADKTEWVNLPSGLCNKIVGGTLTADEKNKA